MPRWQATAAGAAVVLGVLVVGSAVDTVEPPSRPRDEPAPRAIAPNSAPAPEPAPAPQHDADPPPRLAVAVTALPGEDELTVRWNELSPEARIRALRRQYRVAIDEMRRGYDFAVNHARADAAVSALRAELYGTPAGREEHRGLEQQLQTLVERERSQGAPAREERR